MKCFLLATVAMVSIHALAQTTGPFPTAPTVAPNPGPLSAPGILNPQTAGGLTPNPVPALTPGVTTGLTPTPVTGLTPNPVGGLIPNPVGGLISQPVSGVDPVTGLSQPATTIGTVSTIPNTNPLTTPLAAPVVPASTNGLTPSPF